MNDLEITRSTIDRNVNREVVSVLGTHKIILEGLRVLYDESCLRPGSFVFVLNTPGKSSPSITVSPKTGEIILRKLVDSITKAKRSVVSEVIEQGVTIRTSVSGFLMVFDSVSIMSDYLFDRCLTIDTTLIEKMISRVKEEESLLNLYISFTIH
jgi:hypothetical protein